METTHVVVEGYGQYRERMARRNHRINMIGIALGIFVMAQIAGLAVWSFAMAKFEVGPESLGSISFVSFVAGVVLAGLFLNKFLR